MGEHAGLAQRRALRRRHKGAAEEVPRRFRAATDQRGRANQTKQCVSRKVSNQHRKMHRFEGQRNQCGYYRGLLTLTYYLIEN